MDRWVGTFRAGVNRAFAMPRPVKEKVPTVPTIPLHKHRQSFKGVRMNLTHMQKRMIYMHKKADQDLNNRQVTAWANCKFKLKIHETTIYRMLHQLNLLLANVIVGDTHGVSAYNLLVENALYN